MTKFTPQFQQYIRRAAQYMAQKLASNGDAPLLTDDREQAVYILEYALHEPDTCAEAKILLLALTPAMERAGYRTEWMPYLHKGIRQSQHISDDDGVAALNFHLGVLQELVGDYAEARATLQTSAEIFARLGKDSDRGRTLTRLAQVARRQGQRQEATDLAIQALDLLAEDDPERGYSYLVLGAVALDEHDWTRAVELFEQAYQRWQAGDNKLMMARTLNNLGLALDALKQYDKAIAIYEQVITTLGELHDPVNQAVVQMNLGNIYLDLEQPDLALQLFEAAESIFRHSQEHLRLGNIYNNQGLAHNQRGQWRAAIEAFTLSLEHYERVGHVARIVNALDGLGLAHAGQGDPQTALDTFDVALTRLKTIKSDPDYPELFATLTAHKNNLPPATP